MRSPAPRFSATLSTLACCAAMAAASMIGGATSAEARDGDGCRGGWLFDRGCGREGGLLWHRASVGHWPDYSRRFYDPFRGPPCRVGLYRGHGRGLVGRRADDDLLFDWGHRARHRTPEAVK